METTFGDIAINAHFEYKNRAYKKVGLVTSKTTTENSVTTKKFKKTAKVIALDVGPINIYDTNNSLTAIKYFNSNGELHREDGPAVETIGVSYEYYINGKLHREDGPAVEYAEGSVALPKWYLDGVEFANAFDFSVGLFKREA